jgi:hypothetical protein
MAYIGNQVSSVPFIIDTFSGTGSATTFGQLTRSPAGVASIAVFISGVYKVPGVDYTLSGDYIVFTSAPASGTNNIVIHHMGNGSSTQVPSDGSVTGAKLTANAIRGNNIVAGTITGNQIGTGAISGNQIGASAVSGNNIGLQSINASNSVVALSVTGNLIGTSAISGNNIGLQSINASNSVVAGSITGNLIGTQAVTGNLIGTGSISSNHFAGGGITSGVLSSNLTISTVRVAETINIVSSSVQGNYNVHVGNTTVYHFLANSSANVTFNFVANNGTATGTTGRVNDLISIGQSVAVSMLYKQGSTRYRANVYIDGVLQTCYWAGNAQPQYTTSAGAQSMTYDAYNFSIIKIASDQYTVFASNTPYGQANGQGMSSISGAFGPLQ